jgi:hypothetical protein
MALRAGQEEAAGPKPSSRQQPYGIPRRTPQATILGNFSHSVWQSLQVISTTLEKR